MTRSNLLTKRQRLSGPTPLFYEKPIEIVRGEGIYLFDRAGMQYIDLRITTRLVLGTPTPPCIAGAVRQQIGVLNVHVRYLSEGILHYADRLLSKHSAGFDQVVLPAQAQKPVKLLCGGRAAGNTRRKLISQPLTLTVRSSKPLIYKYTKNTQVIQVA